MSEFDWAILSAEDLKFAASILGGLRSRDLMIAPAGKDVPYLYRWHLVRTPQTCVYFHIQVASDPERPLHDHPWDNSSVILANGYDEIVNLQPWFTTERGYDFERKLRKGDMVHRSASEAHRLILPPEFPYAMTLFTTGPKVREWGFWYPDGWKIWTDVTRSIGSTSVHINSEGSDAKS